MESPWLTIEEAAQYARVGVDVLYDAARSGELAAKQRVRKGKWLVHVKALDAWISGEIADIEIPRITRRSA